MGHRCALKLWKGSGREPGEDKEGIWIWVERPGCDRTAWEDFGLPSLQMESQVDSSGKCYPLTTNRQGYLSHISESAQLAIENFMMEPNISTFIYIFDLNLCFIHI